MKTIFITGASSGIGKASAQFFHDKGWYVIATMRHPEKETVLSQLENVQLLTLDVTNVEQITSAVSKAIALRKVDVVLNNAGYGLFGAMEAYTEEQIMRQINTNFLGAVRVTQAFIPYFRAQQGGLFINITSVGGNTGFPFSSIYNATKWALEGWSECLSVELAGFNIGVKTVAPDATKTDLFSRSFDLARHPVYDAAVEKVLAAVDQETLPEEIAAVIYEAATDAADQLRYPAGKKAKGILERRREIGAEEFRREIMRYFVK